MVKKDNGHPSSLFSFRVKFSFDLLDKLINCTLLQSSLDWVTFILGSVGPVIIPYTNRN